jgi:hypothetical protein
MPSPQRMLHMLHSRPVKEKEIEKNKEGKTHTQYGCEHESSTSLHHNFTNMPPT